VFDSLPRSSATETISGSQTWKQTFTFDRYGNRKFDASQTTTLGGCPPAVCNPDINTTNNRVVGHSFDNSGNTTQDAEGRTFFYDAENKQKEVRNAQNQIIGQYLYDGDGKRVKKIAANDTTIFVYDAAGKLASEYLITASQSQAPTTSYLTNDTLGSPRVTTDSSGNVVSRRDFRPYGEEIYRPTQGTDKVRQKFNSYERDNETNLDYAKARMFGSGLGRFTSSDPMMASAKPINPQSMNRYSYTTNNPMKYVDPTGLYTWHQDLGGNTRDEDLLANANAIQDSRARRQSVRDANRIIGQRNKFRNALRDAKAAGENSSDRDRVAVATGSYGKEYENNGVVVTFGENDDNDPGVTTANGQAPLSTNEDGTVSRAEILVRFDNDANTENLILAVAHEGQHVADRQAFANAVNTATSHAGVGNGYNIAANSPWNPSVRSTETRAYRVSALVAEGRGSENLNFSVGRTNYEIYSRDGGINMTRINDFLNASPTYNTRLNDRVFPR
jgi:RHS repeat-associated protein